MRGDTNVGEIQLNGEETQATLRLERMRVQEALTARDVAISRLAEACASVHEKTELICGLRRETERLQEELDACSRPKRLGDSEDKENTTNADPNEDLAVALKNVEVRLATMKFSDPTGMSDGESSGKATSRMVEAAVGRIVKLLNDGPSTSVAFRDLTNVPVPLTLSSPFTASLAPNFDPPESPWTPLEGEHVAALPTVSTAEKIDARYAVLASLPLPCGIPDDSLTPILIPAPYSIHDFIGTTSGLLRSQLGNYRVFQQSTTTWCPDREEHGYYLTPVFKCSTNPRVSTAHKWSTVDFTPKLDKPTECFYNKDGKWYYAGIYKYFRLDDLCPQEWECLSTETSQALIKETLSGRKNTSPQNIYETAQLYSAGALRVACIGLQCMGFNTTLYRGLLEHAALCAQSGKWRPSAASFTSVGLGLVAGSSVGWNSPVSAPGSGPGSPLVFGTNEARVRSSPGPLQTPTIRLQPEGTQFSPTTFGPSLRLSGNT